MSESSRVATLRWQLNGSLEEQLGAITHFGNFNKLSPAGEVAFDYLCSCLGVEHGDIEGFKERFLCAKRSLLLHGERDNIQREITSKMGEWSDPERFSWLQVKQRKWLHEQAYESTLKSRWRLEQIESILEGLPLQVGRWLSVMSLFAGLERIFHPGTMQPVLFELNMILDRLIECLVAHIPFPYQWLDKANEILRESRNYAIEARNLQIAFRHIWKAQAHPCSRNGIMGAFRSEDFPLILFSHGGYGHMPIRWLFDELEPLLCRYALTGKCWAT